MKTVLICYASTGGNTHVVCEEVGNVLREAGINVLLQRVETMNTEDFEEYEYILWGSPTYGHGLLELRMERFVYKRGKDLDLTGKKCAVIGLGDPKYDDDYLAEAAVLLEEFARNAGADILCENLKVIENPVPQLISHVRPWANALAEIIKNHS